MENFNVSLIHLYEQIEYDRYILIDLLDEIEVSNYKPISKYIVLLSLNYISLSELSYSIKEFFLLKKIYLL